MTTHLDSSTANVRFSPPGGDLTGEARASSAAPAGVRSARWPTSRAELCGALEANEVFFSSMEILPDYAHCGINE